MEGLNKKEIIRAYKDRPNAKRIQEIADLNGVTANTIRKILHDAGEDVAVFGPGRPKMSDTKEAAARTLLEADKVLKDESEEKCIKTEPVEGKMQDETVPQVVIDLCHERIANINRQIQVYIEQVDKLNCERNDINDFLERDGHGDKNGVHGQV